MTAPLWDIEHELKAQNREARAAYEEKVAAAKEDGGSELLQRPSERRLLVQDTTVEKLADVMSDNPNGLFCKRDEMSGLFDTWSRPDRSADKAFYLEAASGTQGGVVDRIKRGTQHIDAVCLSMLGTIQPEPLQSYLARQRERGPGADGLIQRFLVVAPAQVRWDRPEKPLDEGARATYHDAVRRLWEEHPATLAGAQPGRIMTDQGTRVELPSDPLDPPLIGFTHDAEEEFLTWRDALETRLRDRAVPAQIAALLGKQRGLVPRIAAVLHLLGGGSGNVPSESLQMAIEWGRILETHAAAIYGADSTPTPPAPRGSDASEAQVPPDSQSLTPSLPHRQDWLAHPSCVGVPDSSAGDTISRMIPLRPRPRHHHDGLSGQVAPCAEPP